MGLSLQFFGEIAIRDGSGKTLSLPTRKTLALLAYLAVNAERSLRREQLASLLWGDRSEQQARQSLSQALRSIRRLDETGEIPLIRTEGEQVTLCGAAVESDIQRFQALVKDDPIQAAALYKGPFLAALSVPSPTFSEWQSSTRSMLHRQARKALEQSAEVMSNRGNFDTAINFVRHLIELDPISENAHRHLMRLFHISGQRVEALRQYQICKEILWRELQVEPDAVTATLLKKIRTNTIVADEHDWCKLPKNSISTSADKPSIAVLPFTNMSGDLDQEYFADGITQDIITELSRFDGLFVIARNSSFSYKGQMLDTKEIAKELDVHFVLEGNVRKSEQRVRINTKLINGRDGRHIWAERYDGTLESVFDLQERVTSQVVGSIAPKISASEIERIRQGEKLFDQAHDFAWQALGILWTAIRQGKPAMLERAIEMAVEAVSLNARCGLGYEVICRGYYYKDLFHWGKDAICAPDLAEKWARKFHLELPNSYMAYFCRGLAQQRKGNLKNAIREYINAHGLNPNDAEVLRYWATCSARAGEFESAKKNATLAIRLNPKDDQVGIAYMALARAAFVEKDANFEELVGRAIQEQPYVPARRALMIAYAGEAGDQTLLNTHLTELMRFSPDFINRIVCGEIPFFEKYEHRKMLLDGLRKGGLC